MRPLDQPIPLGGRPLAVVRPAIEAALVRFAREDAYLRWLAGEQTAALKTAICVRDELPAVGAVALTTYLPLLVLD